jgi:hypothetical protein
VAKLHDTQAILLMVSQVRIKIDGYVTSQKVGVGHAPLFYASTIVQFKAKQKRGSVAKAGPQGEDVVATVTKNSLASPLRQARLRMVYGHGFDAHDSLLSVAVDAGLAEPGRAGWYTIGTGKKAKRVQGSSGLAQLEQSDPKAFEEFGTQVYAVIRGTAPKGKKGGQDGRKPGQGGKKTKREGSKS